MFVLKRCYTSSFAATVIIAIQNALTQSFAILWHTCIQVIVICRILKCQECFRYNNPRFSVTLQKQIGFSHPLHSSRQSVWQGHAKIEIDRVLEMPVWEFWNELTHPQYNQQRLGYNPSSNPKSYNPKHIVDIDHHISKCKLNSNRNHLKINWGAWRWVTEGTDGQSGSTCSDGDATVSSRIVQKTTDSLILYVEWLRNQYIWQECYHGKETYASDSNGLRIGQI